MNLLFARFLKFPYPYIIFRICNYNYCKLQTKLEEYNCCKESKIKNKKQKQYQKIYTRTQIRLHLRTHIYTHTHTICIYMRIHNIFCLVLFLHFHLFFLSFSVSMYFCCCCCCFVHSFIYQPICFIILPYMY